MDAKTASRWSKQILGISVLGAVPFLSPTVRAQETGESLFKGKCAMCHGLDGAGKTMMGEKLKVPDFHSKEIRR